MESPGNIYRKDVALPLLSSQPKMGRARDDLSLGLRSMPFGRYVIFYEPLPDGIDIVRVLHSARDIDTVFDPEPDVPQ